MLCSILTKIIPVKKLKTLPNKSKKPCPPMLFIKAAKANKIMMPDDTNTTHFAISKNNGFLGLNMESLLLFMMLPLSI
jgi:hypothetical protein